MKTLRFFSTIVILNLLIISCGSDDNENGENGNSNCGSVIDQLAQVTFKGVDFEVKGGTYRFQAQEYFCRIYVSELTSGDCAFPQFEGNQGSVLFSLKNLDKQTLMLSDESGADNTLNFNSIETNTTFVELATCGQIEILSSTSTTVTGRVIAQGQEGSTINGNFTLTVCTE